MLATIGVVDHMHRTTQTLTASMLVCDAVNQLLSKNLSGLPVVNEQGAVIGFLSEQDCIRSMLSSSYYCENTKLVGEVMMPDPLVLDVNESVVQAAEKMITHKLRVFPIINQGALVGYITRADILRALHTHLRTCSLPAHA